MTPSPCEWIIGTHHLRFEPPDLLWTRFHGSCSYEQAIDIVQVYRQLAAAQSFFVLNDMEHAQGMDSESRRHMSEQLRREWLRGVIFFKARLLHRALAQGMQLAAAMFRVDEDVSPPGVHFVSTQEEALTLLARLRAEHETRAR